MVRERKTQVYNFIVNFDLSAACEVSSCLVAEYSEFLCTERPILVYCETFRSPFIELENTVSYPQ